MGVATATRKRAYSKYVCGRCGRKLKVDRYIRSSFTGAKFCWPGSGCNK